MSDIVNTYTQLAAINVNDKIEKKNGLSYLSWAWAWDQLQRVDPESSFEYLEPKMFGETMMVYCRVTLGNGKSRTAHLPVMDHRNKPIANPDAFQVNTAMQRCFVKAIAMHGLGLYIYAGEDLPEGESKPAANEPRETNRQSNSTKEAAFLAMPSDEQMFLRGIAQKVTDLIKEGRAYDAYGYWMAQKLDVEEMVAIQHLWNSKERTELTKAAAEWKLAHGPSTRGDNHQGATPQREAA